jgi:hypothetical protein
VSSALIKMTPVSMSAPPVSSAGDGILPSRSHAYSTAKRTSAMLLNEASLAPVHPATARTSQAARRQQEG